MAQHSLKQRIQKDKLLQHSYYCIEEPMQSGGQTGHDSRDFNRFIRTNKDSRRRKKSTCPSSALNRQRRLASCHLNTTNKMQDKDVQSYLSMS